MLIYLRELGTTLVFSLPAQGTITQIKLVSWLDTSRGFSDRVRWLVFLSQ